MKLGICIPHYGRPIEVGRLLEVVRRAEERGLDSVWVTDHVIVPRDLEIIYRDHMLDPLAVLPWLAGVTQRIALGTSVVILPYRSPIPVAKLLASVDVLSGGRLIFAAAIGWMEGEFAALGVPIKERASRSDEALGTHPGAVDPGVPGDPDEAAPARRRQGVAHAHPETPTAHPGRRRQRGGIPAGGPLRRRLARLLDRPRRVSAGEGSHPPLLEGGGARRDADLDASSSAAHRGRPSGRGGHGPACAGGM